MWTKPQIYFSASALKISQNSEPKSLQKILSGINIKANTKGKREFNINLYYDIYIHNVVDLIEKLIKQLHIFPFM